MDVSGARGAAGRTLLREATMVPRLAAFHKQTQPVIEYYRSRGILSSINADQPFKKVYDDITAALNKGAAANAAKTQA